MGGGLATGWYLGQQQSEGTEVERGRGSEAGVRSRCVAGWKPACMKMLWLLMCVFVQLALLVARQGIPGGSEGFACLPRSLKPPICKQQALHAGLGLHIGFHKLHAAACQLQLPCLSPFPGLPSAFLCPLPSSVCHPHTDKFAPTRILSMLTPPTPPPHTPKGIGKLVCDARAAGGGKDPIVLPFFHSGMAHVMPYYSGVLRAGNEVTVVVGEPVELGHITCRWGRRPFDSSLDGRGAVDSLDRLPRFPPWCCSCAPGQVACAHRLQLEPCEGPGTFCVHVCTHLVLSEPRCAFLRTPAHAFPPPPARMFACVRAGGASGLDTMTHPYIPGTHCLPLLMCPCALQVQPAR